MPAFRAFKPPSLFGTFAMGNLPKGSTGSLVALSSLQSIHTSNGRNILGAILPQTILELTLYESVVRVKNSR